MTDERLDEIKTRWNIPVTLPMAVPWGKDDVAWLVGEVERLRAEAKGLSRTSEDMCEWANFAGGEVRHLRAENERLRAALDAVMDACDAECAACGAYYVAKKALDGKNDNKKEKP